MTQTTDIDPNAGTLAFDGELAALFADAAPPARDPDFEARIMARLHGPAPVRLYAIGGAAALGALVAGFQLAPLAEAGLALAAWLGAAAAPFLPEQVGPELVAATVCAGLVWLALRATPALRAA